MKLLPDERLVCPKCGSGEYCGVFPRLVSDAGVEIAPERVLCKWCGFCYSDAYGEIQAEPNGDKGYWDRREGEAKWLTPKEIAEGLDVGANAH